MAQEELVVHGAREHNLQDVTVRLPRHSLICVTGLSGSGKSSLAFDTIYAEGQRRYVESLSAYARQFLQMMEKPDVDSIDGLSPAISIDQKTTSRNPRSTVGTVTEIYDYLRLLYARIGKPHCPVCGRPIAGQSQEAIVDQILQLAEGTKFTVNAPVVRDRKGEYKDVFEELRAEGFTRVKVDGEQLLLEDEIVLDKKFKHTIEVVVDRLVMKQDLRQRLAQSVETAASLAEGLVTIDVLDGEELTFSENFACPEHGVGLPELEPRIFSFNSPHGACPRCTGLGAQQEIDPDLLVPDPALSISEGALVPWSLGNSSFYESVIQAIADRYEIDLELPWQELSEEHQNLFLFGTNGDKVYVQYRNRMGRKRSYMLAFEGIVASLERRYRETDSSQQRERIEEYMSFRPCPVCHGARLKPEVLAVTVGGKNIHEFTRMSVQRAIEFVDGLELTKTEQLIGERILKEIRERLTFLENVGVGYLQLDRAASTLSGGEAQRLRLATQIGSQLVGVLYILDEPSIGLHQRDNGKLIGTLERLRDLGNTVLVVEHDEQMMRAADHLVDMGPGAGVHGGHVVAEGTAKQVERNPKSITGQFLSGKRQIAIPQRRDEDLGSFSIRGASMHNLKDIDVEFPVGKFVCVTGVSGSGKSTLVNEIVYKALANRLHRMRVKPGDHLGCEGIECFDKVIDIDQSPIGRTPRSNPATYTDIFTPVRELYSMTPEAKVRGYKPGRFSFNVRGGRCETCKGDGTIKIEMHFLPGRLRALRDVRRQALQPRDARGSLQGQVHRRRARDVGRGGAGVLRQDPEAPPAAADAARRRARLHQARPARDDALGRRGAADQAREGARQDRDRPDALHPRRAHDGPAFRRHREAARGAPAARGRGQHGARDRAQPRRDQAGGLDRRPRARGRRGRRRGDRHGHSGAGGRGRSLGDGAVPARDPAGARDRRGLAGGNADQPVGDAGRLALGRVSGRAREADRQTQVVGPARKPGEMLQLEFPLARDADGLEHAPALAAAAVRPRPALLRPALRAALDHEAQAGRVRAQERAAARPGPQHHRREPAAVPKLERALGAVTRREPRDPGEGARADREPGPVA